MSWAKNTFFGGAEKDAAKQQIAAGDRAMATQKEYYDQARNDIMSLFPQAYQGIQSSFQQGIDQISAGKTSAADILKQAFNQSNQIQQSGSNAAISALLGRPQQMQLPQQVPAPKPQPSPLGLRSGMNMQMNKSIGSEGRMEWMMPAGGAPQSEGAPVNMFRNMNTPQQTVGSPMSGVGGVATNITQPPPQTQFNAPLSQPTNLGQAPQVQNNVDMSGIGLSGAENALQGGLNSQIGALNQGFGGAENALNAYGSQALGASNQGFSQGRNDLSNAMGAAQGSIGQGIGLLANAQNQGLGRIDQSTGQAINYLNPYASTGAEAQQREAALSGALGNQAQQQAIAGFMESPGQKFLRERQEQALLRNASATGGLRGGSTLSALQEQASGIAAQQQQQQLENMRNIAQRGQQAAGQQGQFAQTGGVSGANLIGQIAGQQAGLLGQQAGLQANTGGQMAQLAAQGGQFAGNTLNNLGSQVSGLRSGLGQLESNAYGNTANNLAGLRSQAGQQVAGQLNNQTNQLSNNQLNLGQLLAGLDTNTAAQIANMMTQGGVAGANNQMNLAQLLANLASGQGTNQSNIQIGQGNAQAGGTVGSAAGAREGFGTLLNAGSAFMTGGLMSDERLKDNITKVADGVVGLFTWTWKHIEEIPELLRGVASVGVIAQEVQSKFPECVMEHNGYLAVNYSKLSQEVANV